MPPLPDPLHPALIHFPIAFLLLGMVVALVAVFFRGWHLPWFAAVLLVLGAAGAIGGTWSGDTAKDATGTLTKPAHDLLEEHEEWGERTRNVAIAAALFAVASALATDFPRFARGLGVAAALGALVASYTVAQAGHYGGLLVYSQGVGIKSTASGAAGAALPAARTKGKDRD